MNKIILAAAIGAGLMLGVPTKADAQSGYRMRTIECSSTQGRYHECRLPVHGQARVVSQLSQRSCVRGRTWGQHGSTLWVSRGCRARFAVSQDRRDGGGYGDRIGDNRNSYDYDRDGRMDSYYDRDHDGRLDGTYDSDRDGRLDSTYDRDGDGRMDSNYYGDSYNYDYDRDGRMDSYYDRDHDGRLDGTYDSDRDGRLDSTYDRDGDGRMDSNYYGSNDRMDGSWVRDNNYSVTCSSRDGRRSTCTWDTRYGNPRMVQQLSSTQCIEGRDWGYDSQGGLWVDAGCEARFGYR